MYELGYIKAAWVLFVLLINQLSFLIKLNGLLYNEYIEIIPKVPILLTKKCMPSNKLIYNG